MTAPAPSRIALLTTGINVAPLAAALRAHPELWNRDPARTAPPGSPHREIDDIWCRYGPPGTSGGEPHYSVWYPAAGVLPVAGYANSLMAELGGTALGGILITRVPPGGMVHPHTDTSWHAGFYEKFALQVESHADQAFHFEGQSLVTAPGDLFTFDNAHTHWVTNDSPKDRITALFCIRMER